MSVAAPPFFIAAMASFNSATSPIPRDRSFTPADCAARSVAWRLVLPVRPSGVPKVVNRRLRLAQVSGEFHVLSAQVCEYVAKPGDVAARVGEARDKPDADGVANADEQNGNRRRMALRRQRRACADRYQELSATLHQPSYRSRGFRLAAGPHDIEHDVSIFDHPKIVQTLSERLNQRAVVRVGR